MKAIAYFKIRALEYERRAVETTDLTLRDAYRAMAADMKKKAATADPDRRVVAVDRVPVDPSWTLDQPGSAMHTLD
jgi:hypothetical protein